MMIQYRRQLPDLMKSLNLPMVAVELGSAEGYSAAEFMLGGLEKLYMVDNWNFIPDQRGDGNNPSEWHNANLKAAQERLKKYGDKVMFLRGMTSEMAWMIPDNSCGMVYLDGDHSYEGVTQDLFNYIDKLVDGGILAGHDFLAAEYGVKKAVVDFCEFYKYEINIIREDKDEDAGFWFQKK